MTIEKVPFSEDLRRQDDGAALRVLGSKQLDNRSLEDGVHATRELVEKHDRNVDHEHLRDLHSSSRPAAEILDLLIREAVQPELSQYVVCATAQKNC